MIQNTTKSAALLAALTALTGCDSQASSDYQGEPLLRIRGNVSIPQGLESAELVPVIAFEAFEGDGTARHSDHMRILDVEVTGDFPSSFSLGVFEPPPPSTFRYFAAEPPVATGHISAMAPGHPDEVTQRLDFGPHDPLNPTRVHLDTCERDTSDCWQQAFDCSQGMMIPDGCALVSTSGSEDAAFAGFSKNAVVFYFPETVPAGTWSSFYFNDGGEMAPGYYLYERAPYDEIPSDGLRECLGGDEGIREAMALALARFNEEHGTNLTEAELNSYETREEAILWAAWRTHVERVRVDRGCPRHGRLRHVVDPENHSISIQLGAVSSFEF